jgi:hypothetical protein
VLYLKLMNRLGYLTLCLVTAAVSNLPLALGRDTNPIMVSRYSGIVGVVQIGDTEKAVLARLKWENKRTELPKDHQLAKIRFTHMLSFPDGGIRAYFRNERVALLEIQDPFQGEIQGTRLSVFKPSSAQPEKWDEVLQQELGRMPRARAGNGSFGSEALFYDWGDIAFGKSGPQEMAIYRDPEIAKYRQTNFGRKIEMWKSPH